MSVTLSSYRNSLNLELIPNRHRLTNELFFLKVLSYVIVLFLCYPSACVSFTQFPGFYPLSKTTCFSTVGESKLTLLIGVMDSQLIQDVACFCDTWNRLQPPRGSEHYGDALEDEQMDGQTEMEISLLSQREVWDSRTYLACYGYSLQSLVPDTTFKVL